MKILDIALKDLVRSFRSLFAVGMMFVAPLLITGLIYAAFGGSVSGKTDLPATRVVVVNLDVPPAGQPALGQMASDMFKDPSVARWLQASDAAGETEARSQVDGQLAGVAVIIPVNFSRALLSGEGRPEVKLIQDPTLTIGPLVVKNMLGSLIDGISGARIALETEAKRRAALGLPSDGAAQAAFIHGYQQWFTDFQRSLYHSPQAALVTRAATTSGVQASDLKRMLSLALIGQVIYFGFFTGAYAMMSILREDEEGTLARLFTTPTSRIQVLAGKFLAVVLIVAVQALVILVIGALVFGVNWGNPVSVALAVLGQVAAATGLGVLLISLVKTSRQAGPVLGGGLTALGMLGGLFTVSVPSMPRIFETIGSFTPQGWVLKGWQACLAGGGPLDLLRPAAILLVMGAILFFAGAILFRRRFA